MKRIYWLVSTLSLAFTLLIPGCGGGGGGGGSQTSASTSGMAPNSAAGRNLRLIDSTGTMQTVAFAVQDNRFTQFDTASGTLTRSGTFVYSPSANTATVSLTDSASHEVVTLHLNFETASSGTFNFSSSTGTVGNGRFENFNSDASGNAAPPSSGGGPAGATGEGTRGQPSTGGASTETGSAGLDGRMMTLTRSTGQTHSYSFSGNRFTDSDPPELGTGTYSFTRNGSQATLILQYTGSSPAVDLRGDRHEVQMTFNTETDGTYTGTYTIHDGTVLPQTGTFHFIQ